MCLGRVDADKARAVRRGCGDAVPASSIVGDAVIELQDGRRLRYAKYADP